MNSNKIHNTLMEIGALSGCHQLPERSFFIKGYQFPVCARCTGVLIGYLIGMIIWVIHRLSILPCVILCLIMYLDWKLQDLQWIPSTNFRRLITGILCGIGYIQLIARGINSLGRILLQVYGGIGFTF